MINKHKSNKIKENSNTVRHLNNGTDHRHSKSCCDQSSPARRTIRFISRSVSRKVNNFHSENCILKLMSAKWRPLFLGLNVLSSRLMSSHKRSMGFRAPSQYPKRRLIVRSREVSKPRDLNLEFADRSEIWQALRQHCCRCVCQISKPYAN